MLLPECQAVVFLNFTTKPAKSEPQKNSNDVKSFNHNVPSQGPSFMSSLSDCSLYYIIKTEVAEKKLNLNFEIIINDFL